MSTPPTPATPAGPQDAPVPPPPGSWPGQPSTLVVHVDRFSRAAATKSNVYVDGVRMVNQDGPNLYAVVPGRHMVSAEVNASGRTYGQADLQVEVPPGARIEVFYAAPATLTTPGRLAFQPVDNAGAGAVRFQRGCGIGLLVFIIVVIAVIVIAVIGVASGRSDAGEGPAPAPVSQTDPTPGGATG